MRTTVACSMLSVSLMAVGAKADSEGPEGKAEVRKPGASVRLQVVLSRYQGDKKVASLPYTLSANANGEPARLRMGLNVPLRYESKDYPGNVAFKSVGNNVDCTVLGLEDGRFRVSCNIEQSSVYANGSGGKPGPGAGQANLVPPVLTHFSSETLVILADGQSAQHSTATDPVTGEVARIDVTLNVVK